MDSEMTGEANPSRKVPANWVGGGGRKAELGRV